MDINVVFRNEVINFSIVAIVIDNVYAMVRIICDCDVMFEMELNSSDLSANAIHRK